MKRLLLSTLLGAFTLSATSAMAVPVKLTKAQLDKVVAGTPATNQQATPPGQFPGGGPHCCGNANSPGNSGK